MRLKWKLRNELHGTDQDGNGVSCLIPLIGNCLVLHKGRRIAFKHKDHAIRFAFQLCYIAQGEHGAAFLEVWNRIPGLVQ